MSTEPSILWGRNAVASQVDGHSETLGAKADAASADSLIGLTKYIKARSLEIVARLGELTDTSAQDTLLGRLTALGKTSDTSASSTIGGWVQLVAARLPASLSTGNLRVSLESSNASQAVTSAASSQADGHSATLGATGDADTATTVIGRLKKLITLLPAALTAGGNLKVSLQESNASQAVTGTLTASPSVIATATAIGVASSATSVALVGARADRLGMVLDNNSNQGCYLQYGGAAGKTVGTYTWHLYPGERWSMSEPIWRGAIEVIWDAANGHITGKDLSP